MYTNIILFPFIQLGESLRELSLSGTMGNVAAIIVYVAISLIPTGVLVWRVKKQKKPFEGVDLILPLLSVFLLVMMYLLINPGYIAEPSFAGNSALRFEVGLVSTFWSVLIGYLILKSVRLFGKTDEKGLLRYFNIAIVIVGVYLALAMASGVYTELIPALNELDMGRFDIQPLDGDIEMTKSFLITRYVGDQLPLLMDIIVLFTAMGLIKAMHVDRYGAETLEKSKKLAKVCITCLAVMVLEPIAINLFQLFLGSTLLKTTYNMQMPWMSLIMVLIVLLLTKFFEADKALKEDSDMII